MRRKVLVCLHVKHIHESKLDKSINKSLRQSKPLIYLGLRKGRKTMLAAARRKVATKYESIPERLLPMIPKEKAQIIDTTAR